jgi:hypothetical protein
MDQVLSRVVLNDLIGRPSAPTALGSFLTKLAVPCRNSRTGGEGPLPPRPRSGDHDFPPNGPHLNAETSKESFAPTVIFRGCFDNGSGGETPL